MGRILEATLDKRGERSSGILSPYCLFKSADKGVSRAKS